MATDVAAKRLDLPKVDLIVQCKPLKVHVCKKEAVCVYISYECVVRESVHHVCVCEEGERQTVGFIFSYLHHTRVFWFIYACIQ